MSKHDDNFYYLKCLCSFRTKNKLELHKEVRENKDVCNIAMPSKEAKILEFNQYQNLIKHHILFMQIFNIQQKRLMDIKIMLKKHLQQK